MISLLCPRLNSFFLFSYAGTFAVISLMVGAVVDKGHVAWQRQELQGAINDINTGHNITHPFVEEEVMTTALPGNGSGVNNMLRNKHLSELHSIKVGYAMAVTFAVGILQVNVRAQV